MTNIIPISPDAGIVTDQGAHIDQFGQVLLIGIFSDLCQLRDDQSARFPPMVENPAGYFWVSTANASLTPGALPAAATDDTQCRKQHLVPKTTLSAELLEVAQPSTNLGECFPLPRQWQAQ